MSLTFHSKLADGKVSSHRSIGSSEIIQTSALLKLPQEIRNHIWDYLVYFTQDPPQGAQIVSRWLKLKTSSYRDGIIDARDAKDAFPRIPRAKHLLLICKQVRAEILYPSRKFEKRRPVARLDVLVSGYRWYPTWTQIPMIFNAWKSIDLIVTLRIISGESFGLLNLTSSISLGTMATIDLITPLRGYLRDQQDREVINTMGRPLPVLRTASFELHCRDQYTSGGFGKLATDFQDGMADLVASTTFESAPSFRKFSVAIVDPTRSQDG